MVLRGGGNPRRIARIKRTIRSGKRYKTPGAAESRDQGIKKCPGAALEAARGPDARQFAHEEAQIRATDVDEQTLEHVGVSAQMHAAQSPGFVEVGVGTLEAFPTLPQQAPAADTPNAPPVGVDGRPRRRLSPPADAARGPAPTRNCGFPTRPTPPRSRCCDIPYRRPPR